jgi:hypothetical protein
LAAQNGGSLKTTGVWIPGQHRRDWGETMSIQTQTALREAARDFAMVSAFGFWAVVIGFAPVAIRMLMA